MMRVYEEIKEMLEKELAEESEKHELSAGSLETIHKLTDTIKNIDKIIMFECGEDEGYSTRSSRRGGRYSRDGGYMSGNPYRRGSSYNSGSRGGNYTMRGNYSYDDGRQGMIERLEELRDNMSGDERDTIQRCLEMLNR